MSRTCRQQESAFLATSPERGFAERDDRVYALDADPVAGRAAARLRAAASDGDERIHVVAHGAGLRARLSPRALAAELAECFHGESGAFHVVIHACDMSPEWIGGLARALDKLGRFAAVRVDAFRGLVRVNADGEDETGRPWRDAAGNDHVEWRLGDGDAVLTAQIDRNGRCLSGVGGGGVVVERAGEAAEALGDIPTLEEMAAAAYGHALVEGRINAGSVTELQAYIAANGPPMHFWQKVLGWLRVNNHPEHLYSLFSTLDRIPDANNSTVAQRAMRQLGSYGSDIQLAWVLIEHATRARGLVFATAYAGGNNEMGNALVRLVQDDWGEYENLPAVSDLHRFLRSPESNGWNRPEIVVETMIKLWSIQSAEMRQRRRGIMAELINASTIDDLVGFIASDAWITSDAMSLVRGNPGEMLSPHLARATEVLYRALGITLDANGVPQIDHGVLVTPEKIRGATHVVLDWSNGEPNTVDHARTVLSNIFRARWQADPATVKAFFGRLMYENEYRTDLHLQMDDIHRGINGTSILGSLEGYSALADTLLRIYQNAPEYDFGDAAAPQAREFVVSLLAERMPGAPDVFRTSHAARVLARMLYLPGSLDGTVHLSRALADRMVAQSPGSASERAGALFAQTLIEGDAFGEHLTHPENLATYLSQTVTDLVGRHWRNPETAAGLFKGFVESLIVINERGASWYGRTQFRALAQVWRDLGDIHHMDHPGFDLQILDHLAARNDAIGNAAVQSILAGLSQGFGEAGGLVDVFERIYTETSLTNQGRRQLLRVAMSGIDDRFSPRGGNRDIPTEFQALVDGMARAPLRIQATMPDHAANAEQLFGDVLLEKFGSGRDNVRSVELLLSNIMRYRFVPGGPGQPGAFEMDTAQSPSAPGVKMAARLWMRLYQQNREGALATYKSMGFGGNLPFALAVNENIGEGQHAAFFDILNQTRPVHLGRSFFSGWDLLDEQSKSRVLSVIEESGGEGTTLMRRLVADVSVPSASRDLLLSSRDFIDRANTRFQGLDLALAVPQRLGKIEPPAEIGSVADWRLPASGDLPPTTAPEGAGNTRLLIQVDGSEEAYVAALAQYKAAPERTRWVQVHPSQRDAAGRPVMRTVAGEEVTVFGKEVHTRLIGHGKWWIELDEASHSQGFEFYMGDGRSGAQMAALVTGVEDSLGARSAKVSVEACESAATHPEGAQWDDLARPMQESFIESFSRARDLAGRGTLVAGSVSDVTVDAAGQRQYRMENESWAGSSAGGGVQKRLVFVHDDARLGQILVEIESMQGPQVRVNARRPGLGAQTSYEMDIAELGPEPTAQKVRDTVEEQLMTRFGEANPHEAFISVHGVGDYVNRGMQVFALIQLGKTLYRLLHNTSSSWTDEDRMGLVSMLSGGMGLGSWATGELATLLAKTRGAVGTIEEGAMLTQLLETRGQAAVLQQLSRAARLAQAEIEILSGVSDALGFAASSVDIALSIWQLDNATHYLSPQFRHAEEIEAAIGLASAVGGLLLTSAGMLAVMVGASGPVGLGLAVAGVTLAVTTIYAQQFVREVLEGPTVVASELVARLHEQYYDQLLREAQASRQAGMYGRISAGEGMFEHAYAVIYPETDVFEYARYKLTRNDAAITDATGKKLEGLTLQEAEEAWEAQHGLFDSVAPVVKWTSPMAVVASSLVEGDVYLRIEADTPVASAQDTLDNTVYPNGSVQHLPYTESDGVFAGAIGQNAGYIRLSATELAGKPGRDVIVWYAGQGTDRLEAFPLGAQPDNSPGQSNFMARNRFVLDRGHKTIVGGTGDDEVVLLGMPVKGSSYTLRDGNDLLRIALETPNSGYGFKVDLRTGRLYYGPGRTAAAVGPGGPLDGAQTGYDQRATLSSIERALVLNAQGGDWIIGTQDDNLLGGGGAPAGQIDIIEAVGGNNQILVGANSRVWGGQGQDTYFIERGTGTSRIVDVSSTRETNSSVVLMYRFAEILSVMAAADGVLTLVLQGPNGGERHQVEIVGAYTAETGANGQVSLRLGGADSTELGQPFDIMTHDGILLELPKRVQLGGAAFATPAFSAHYRKGHDYLSHDSGLAYRETALGVEIDVQAKQLVRRNILGSVSEPLSSADRLAPEGTAYGDRLLGTEGDDVVMGFGAKQGLESEGALPYDYFEGRGGANTYVLLSGEVGDVRINNYAAPKTDGSYNEDVLIVPVDLSALNFAREGVDLVMRMTETIDLPVPFGSASTPPSSVDIRREVRVLSYFAGQAQRHLTIRDGSKLFWHLDVEDDPDHGENGRLSIVGRVFGSGGEAEPATQPITLPAGSSGLASFAVGNSGGNVEALTAGVTVFGGNGDDTLTAAGAGVQILYGGKGNDQLILDGLGADVAAGGSGNNVIRIVDSARGVKFVSPHPGRASGEVDTLHLPVVPTQAMLSWRNDDLVITWQAADGTPVHVVLQNYGGLDAGLRAYELVGPPPIDGATPAVAWTRAVLDNAAKAAPWSPKATLTVIAAAETQLLNVMDRSIKGTAGNDTLHGNTGDNIFFGKAGDDTLVDHEGGDDVVFYAKGEGKDTIDLAGPGRRVLRLTGIAPETLRLRQDGDDLVIGFSDDAQGAVRVRGALRAGWYPHEGPGRDFGLGRENAGRIAPDYYVEGAFLDHAPDEHDEDGYYARLDPGVYKVRFEIHQDQGGNGAALLGIYDGAQQKLAGVTTASTRADGVLEKTFTVTTAGDYLLRFGAPSGYGTYRLILMGATTSFDAASDMATSGWAEPAPLSRIVFDDGRELRAEDVPSLVAAMSSDEAFGANGAAGFDMQALVAETIRAPGAPPRFIAMAMAWGTGSTSWDAATVYAIDRDWIYRLDRQDPTHPTAQTVRAHDIEGVRAMTGTGVGGQLVVADAAGGLYKFDMATGSKIRLGDTGLGEHIRTLAWHDGKLYAGWAGYGEDGRIKHSAGYLAEIELNAAGTGIRQVSDWLARPIELVQQTAVGLVPGHWYGGLSDLKAPQAGFSEATMKLQLQAGRAHDFYVETNFLQRDGYWQGDIPNYLPVDLYGPDGAKRTYYTSFVADHIDAAAGRKRWRLSIAADVVDADGEWTVSWQMRRASSSVWLSPKSWLMESGDPIGQAQKQETIFGETRTQPWSFSALAGVDGTLYGGTHNAYFGLYEIDPATGQVNLASNWGRNKLFSDTKQRDLIGLTGISNNDLLGLYAESEAPLSQALADPAAVGVTVRGAHAVQAVRGRLLQAGYAVPTVESRNRDGTLGTVCAVWSGSTLAGDEGDNRLLGGVGEDTLLGGDGDDWLEGGSGADVLDGGSGKDTAAYTNSKSGVQVRLGAASGIVATMQGGSFTALIDAPEGVLALDRVELGGGLMHSTWGSGFTGVKAEPVESRHANLHDANLRTWLYAHYDGAITQVVRIQMRRNPTLGQIEYLANAWYRNGDHRKDLATQNVDWGGGWTVHSYASAVGGYGIGLAGMGYTVAQTVGGDAAGDQLRGIENLTGSAHDDILTGDAEENVLDGGSGNDILFGGAGDDHLTGGTGADRLDGGAGEDTAGYAGSGSGVTVQLAPQPGQVDALSGGQWVSLTQQDLGGKALDRIVLGQASMEGAMLGSASGASVVPIRWIREADAQARTWIYALFEGGHTRVVRIDLRGGQSTGIEYRAEAWSKSGNHMRGIESQNIAAGNGWSAVVFGSAGIRLTRMDHAIRRLGSGGDAEGDLLIDIENLTGSAHADTLIGDGGNNVLEGGAGADHLDGGAGTDTASYASSREGVSVWLAPTLVHKATLEGNRFVTLIDGGAPGMLDRVVPSLAAMHGGNMGNLSGSWVIPVRSTQADANGENLRTWLYGLFDGTDTKVVRLQLRYNGQQGAIEYQADAWYRSGDFRSTLATAQWGAAGGWVNRGYAIQASDAGYGLGNLDIDVRQGVGGEAEGDVLAGIENLIGSAYADTLIGDAGANRLDGGAGNDMLIGGAGNDTYRFGRDYGADVVRDDDPTSGNTDTVAFLDGIGADQLWWRKVGNNLEASLIGGGERLTVQDWYLGERHRVEQFTLTNGRTLMAGRVEHLVQAMSAFTPPAAGQNELSQNYREALSGTIASAWNRSPGGAAAVSGTAAVGETLTASHTLSDPDGLGVITWQWQTIQDNSTTWGDIAGATTASFTLTQAQAGRRVRALARYTDGYGMNEAVASAATALVPELALAPGTTVTGRLTLGQRRRYALQIQAGQTLELSLDGRGLWDAYLRLYDGQGRQIAYDDDSGDGLDSRLTHTFAQAGVYYAEAAAYGDKYAGDYVLSATNLVKRSEAPIVRSGHLDGQRQRYVLSNVEAGDRVRFFLDGQNGLDAFFRLHDGQGRLITYNDDGGGQLDSLLEHSFAERGSYLLDAGGYRDSNHGDYVLTVQRLTQAMASLPPASGGSGYNGAAVRPLEVTLASS